MTIDIQKVCCIAKEAGAAIMNIYGSDYQIEFKDDRSPLTAADQAANQIIVSGLKNAFPQIPILSEEGAAIPFSERRHWETFWLVDPLDGTKEFIKRNGEFTVNVALISRGEPVAGVVFAPAQNRLFWGELGVGAWVLPEDGVPRALQVRQADEEAGLTVVMSRSHPSPDLSAFLAQTKVAMALPVGSSLKFCVVAEGRADLYPRLGPTMEWDTAAGHALVLAAGGTVMTPAGLPLCYNKENLLNPHFIVRGR